MTMPLLLRDISSFQEIINYLKSEYGDGCRNKIENVDELIVWLCNVPSLTTVRINTLATTAQQMVDQLSGELTKQRQDMICPHVYVHPMLSELVVIEGWQPSDLDLQPREKQVVVDSRCGAAVLRGAHVFAPGVLAMCPRVRSGDVVSVYADVAGVCRRGLATPFIDPRRAFLGNGVVQMGRTQLFGNNALPSGIAVQMTDAVSCCPALTVPPSLGLLQNLPSVVCGRALDLQPGQTVLDMCAAPGNKTSHLAMLMCDTGLIVALDRTEAKVKQIRSRSEQFSLRCVHTFACDSTKAVSRSVCENANHKEGLRADDEARTKLQQQDLLAGPPFLPESFDRILLDAPCSGLGQRPLLANNITANQLQSYPALQRRLFRAAAALLKQGGRLVYSTCTVTLGENEGLVTWALEHFPELHLVPAGPCLGGTQHPNSRLPEGCGVQRFGPQDTDSVGFFIAAFEKSAVQDHS